MPAYLRFQETLRDHGMPLEFECPYCQATIRVPDKSAGKRGHCPRCKKRLTVPKSAQTRRTGEEPPPFAPPPVAPLPEWTAPAVADAPAGEIVFDEYQDINEPEVALFVPAALPLGDIAIPTFAGPSPLPSSPSELADVLHSTSKRRRSTPGWVWAMLVVLLLGGAGGVVGSVLWLQTSDTLNAELEAKLVDNPPLPATLIPNAMIQVSPADAGLVLSALERDPLALVSGSGIATVQLQGSDRGLLVSVQPGPATSLYRVEVSSDDKLQRFLKEHRQDYERIRDEDLSVAVNQFFRKLKQSLNSKKTAARQFQEFRDRVGFTAPVQGLGYFVHAGYRKQIFPCVAEDNRALYFLLPPGVKRFIVEGKPQRRGLPFFPGTYEVTVNGTITVNHESR